MISKRSRPSTHRCSAAGTSGSRPVARLTASGNFAGCAVLKHNHRPALPGLLPLRGGKAHGRMRIDDNPCVLVQPVHGRRRFLAGDAMGSELLADGLQCRRAESRNCHARANPPLRPSQTKHPGRSPRTEAARNCSKSEYPCSDYRWASRRAVHNGQFQGFRAKMSFSFVAITSLPKGRPIFKAAKPAKMSPKFPVGTVKLGRDSGPSFSAAV